MKTVRVMVTSTGGIVAQGIIKSLKHHNKFGNNKLYKYQILGTDISYDASGLYRCHKFAIISRPEEKDFIKNLMKICTDQKVQALFIGSDVELPIIAKNKEEIESKTSTRVISSGSSLIDLCRDKFATNEFLENNKLSSIPSCLPNDIESFLADNSFPLIVKPREGFGSKLLNLVYNLNELDFAVTNIEKAGWRPMIQKYLKNDLKEYTTGITLDQKTRKIMSIITMKKILKHGQTYKAFIDKYPLVERICKKIVRKLDAIGPINIQTRVDADDSEVKVIEINPRFSASCPMRTVAGINEPDIIIRNILFDEKLSINEYNQLVCMRYWDETYLPMVRYNKIKSEKSKIKNMMSEKIDYF